MAKTLNDEYEGSNEQTTTYYYQDDESTRTHLSVLHIHTIESLGFQNSVKCFESLLFDSDLF